MKPPVITMIDAGDGYWENEIKVNGAKGYIPVVTGNKIGPRGKERKINIQLIEFPKSKRVNLVVSTGTFLRQPKEKYVLVEVEHAGEVVKSAQNYPRPE